MQKIVLGLDIGLSSIGWSLVRLAEEEFEDVRAPDAARRKRHIADFEILDMGVRSFARSEDRLGNPLQSRRSESRRIRTTLTRRRRRKAALRALLREAGLVPETFSKKAFEDALFFTVLPDGRRAAASPSPWALRAAALDMRLTDSELARAVYHIIAHRGFHFSSRSADDEATGAGRVKQSMREMEQAMQAAGARTVGEYLAAQARQRNSRKDEDPGVPVAGAYRHCVRRQWLAQELALILERQRQLGNARIDAAFMDRAHALLMHQKGYDADAVQRMWGKCPIYTGLPRAPQQSATAEYFTLLHRVNSLCLLDSHGGRWPLAAESRAAVMEAVRRAGGSLSFSELRRILGSEAAGRRFNLCVYDHVPAKAEKKHFVELRGMHALRGVFGPRWEEMALHDSVLDALAQVLAVDRDDDSRLAGFAAVEQESGIALSPEEKDSLLGVCCRGSAPYSMAALRQLVPYMEAGARHQEAVERAVADGVLPDFLHRGVEERRACLPPYAGDFRRDPAMCRVFAQARKLINALGGKHGVCIDQIRIEVSQEIACGEARLREIQAGRARAAAQKTRAERRLRELGMQVTSVNILKMRLYLEQGGRCAYTGVDIALNAGNGPLFDDCRIDHILPFGRTLHNGIGNKVLATAPACEEKDGKTSREWLDDAQWEKFEQRVRHAMPGVGWSKKRALLRAKFSAEERETAIRRVCADMRYVSRAVADYLRRYCRFSAARPDLDSLERVQAVAGGATGLLRSLWGLERGAESDDRRHAMAATVIACAEPEHMFFLAGAARHDGARGCWTAGDVFQAEDRLHREMERRLPLVNVSRMARHTVTGAAHRSTVYSMEKMGKKAGRVALVNAGWADMGEMARADIFCDAGGKYYIVPVYPQDFLAQTLPVKAIVSDKPYAEWLDVSDSTRYSFCFSLFKDDLVSLNGIYYYVHYVQGTRPKIALKPFGRPSARESRETGVGAGQWKKHSIAILGRITDVHREKRQGSRKETHPRLRGA